MVMKMIPGLAGALILAATVTSAQTPAVPQKPTGFSGTWALDISRSASAGGASGQKELPGGGRGGGLGLGPSPDQLVITETPAAVTIEEHRGAAVAQIVLALDGKPSTRIVSAGRSSGAPGAAVTKWEKGRLTTMVTLPGVNGAADLQYEETRYLDLGFFVVEIRQIGADNMRRLVYSRVK
jgi:hypothetical protein